MFPLLISYSILQTGQEIWSSSQTCYGDSAPETCISWLKGKTSQAFHFWCSCWPSIPACRKLYAMLYTFWTRWLWPCKHSHNNPLSCAPGNSFIPCARPPPPPHTHIFFFASVPPPPQPLQRLGSMDLLGSNWPINRDNERGIWQDPLTSGGEF